MGMVREQEARYDDALELFQRSLQRHDSAYELAVRHLAVGRTLIVLGRAEAAEAQFERAIELFEYAGRPHEVRNVRANLLESRFEQASPDDRVTLVPISSSPPE